MTVSNCCGVLGTLENRAELRGTFQRETLKAAEECIEEPLSVRSGVTSRETLESKKESRAARLAGNSDQYRALSRRLELP